MSNSRWRSNSSSRCKQTDLQHGTLLFIINFKRNDVQGAPVVPQITQGTKEKAESAKAYIEKKYAKLKNEEKERREGNLL